MARPLAIAAGLDPKSVKVVLIGDPSINAFVMQGQTVYIHSGLIRAADNIQQVHAVFAHQLAHLARPHSLRFSVCVSLATLLPIVSLLLCFAPLSSVSPFSLFPFLLSCFP